MKKSKKIMMVIATMVICIMMISTVALAATTDPNNFKGAGGKTTGIETTGKQLVDVLQTVGTLVAVVVILVLGIKYMMGSPEEKAEYKKTLLPYLIGAIFLFAAVNIVKIVQTIAGNISAT